MDMTTALIVNIALDLSAFAGVLALAAWAIKTGERDAPRRLRAARPQVGPKAESAAVA